MAKNLVRSTIRAQSRLNEHVVVSLQTCGFEENKQILEENIQKAQLSRNLSHLRNLRGLHAILLHLMTNTCNNMKVSRLSYMALNEAFTLFLSFNENATKNFIKDLNRKKQFKDLLCHPVFGLSVYIIYGEFVLLKSPDTDLQSFFSEVLIDRAVREGTSRVNLSDREFIEDLLNSMDTAFDKKVVSVILGAVKTRPELERIGIGKKIAQYTKEVLDVIEKRKAIVSEAKDVVHKSMNNQIRNLEKRIDNETNFLLQNKCKMSDSIIGEHEELIEDLKLRYSQKKISLEEGGKNIKNMILHKKKQLILKNRLGMRKASSGRPLMMDEIDEKFLLQCIENKSTEHGRRTDSVMYVGRRVKKRDFLKLANMSRISRGLKPIKSATTVSNRARPKNKRSTQAKKHTGLGLFCCKKPPKLKDIDNLLTHHQRAFKKNILIQRTIEPKEDESYNLFVSRDDKAYICPGTSTGSISILFKLPHSYKNLFVSIFNF